MKEFFQENSVMFILTVVYIVVFIVMLIASLIVAIRNKVDNRSLDKDIKKYLHYLRSEEALIYDNRNVSTEHIKFISKNLHNHRFLRILDGALQILTKKNKTIADGYVYAISKSVAIAIKETNNKSPIHRAYFAYLMSQYPLNPEFEDKAIINFLLENLTYNSIYCRENSLRALALFGNAEYFLQGLRTMSDSEFILQIKLLSDCLNIFTGDKKHLTELLFENFKSYRSEVKAAIINFVKNNDDPDDIKFVLIYLKTETDEEVLYSCIKYFGKTKYDPALDTLLKIGYDSLEREKWGFVAVIATALQKYRCKKSVDFLYKVIASKDWQSRENSAKTLAFFFGSRAFKIVEKYEDKYASEMIRYVIDDRNIILEEEKKEG